MSFSFPFSIWRLSLGLSALAWAAAGFSAWPWSSPLRALLAALAWLLSAVCLAAAIFWGQIRSRMPRLPGLRFFFPLTGMLLLAARLLPAENTGAAYYYFLALVPYLTAAFFTWLALCLAWLAAHPSRWQNWWRSQQKFAQTGLLTLLVLVVLLVAARAWLGQAFEDYWYGAGVPVLTGQALLAFGIGWLAWQAGERLPSTRRLFFAVWLTAAIAWAWQPVPPSFFVTPKMPPNAELYPFADAMVFDWGSQFALIGQKLNNGVFYDRVLYMTWLTWLHALAGQRYETLMAIQAAVFALFPALAFLIATDLHSRPAGLSVAALLTLRELNNLAGSNWMATSASKHMLTDFPTALGVALFTWLALRWLLQPERLDRLAWAAGCIGFLSMLRPHALAFLPFLLFLAWLRAPSRRWQAGGLAVAAFFISVSPWALLGAGVSPLALYRSRLEGVFSERYRPTPSPLPVTGTPIAAENPALETPVGAENPPLPVVSTPQTPTAAESAPELPFPLRHLAHNLLESAVSLPLSPQLLTLRQTLRGDWSFWREDWNGDFPAETLPWLGFGLALTALGSAAAFSHAGSRAWLPWSVFGLYMSANALARTSGGRYLVPADWLWLVYFGIGMAQLSLWLSVSENGEEFSARENRPAPLDQQPAESVKPVWTALILIGLLAGIFPLTNVLFPPRYTRSQAQLQTAARQALPPGELETWLASPQVILTEGRALYPRWLKPGVYLPLYSEELLRQEFARIDFFLLGPQGVLHVFLKQEQPPVPLPNGSDVLLIGCPVGTSGYVEALALLDEQGRLLARPPAQEPLACP